MFNFSWNFYLYTILVFVDRKFTWAEVSLNKHSVLVPLETIIANMHIVQYYFWFYV